jgi:hypothetical protein
VFYYSDCHLLPSDGSAASLSQKTHFKPSIAVFCRSAWTLMYLHCPEFQWSRESRLWDDKLLQAQFFPNSVCSLGNEEVHRRLLNFMRSTWGSEEMIHVWPFPGHVAYVSTSISHVAVMPCPSMDFTAAFWLWPQRPPTGLMPRARVSVPPHAGKVDVQKKRTCWKEN